MSALFEDPELKVSVVQNEFQHNIVVIERKGKDNASVRVMAVGHYLLYVGPCTGCEMTISSTGGVNVKHSA